MAEANFRAGDVLTAQMLNDIVRGQALDVRGSGGLTVRSSDGRNIQLAVNGFGGLVVKVSSGGITARVGTTPGKGDCNVQAIDPSTGLFIDAGITVKDVLRYSSTAGGIGAGVYGFILADQDGNIWIISLDCG